MRSLAKLFFSFTYIGAFTFGGGYSMLPMFHRVVAQKNGWLTEEEMTDIFSLSQCLPGIIAVNSAVFVGYGQKGVAGSIAAALGATLPSLVIITAIAAFISGFSDYPAVEHAFAGIRVCVCVLIINTVVKLWKQSITDKLAIVIFTAVFLISAFTSISAAVLVVSAGCAGIAASKLRKGGAK